MEIIFGKPYIDEGNVREFDSTLSESHYVWHRDDSRRTIEILKGDGWCLQFEDCLPILLKPCMKITIKMHEYHRLIKGINNLKIRIIHEDK